jgi:preprotein translocase subunit SecD
VAPPTQGQMRPSRYLMVLTALFVVLFGIVLFTGPSSMGDKLKPNLGLDLVGGTSLTLIAQATNGQAINADSVEQARNIIQSRVDGFGVAEAEVVIEGNTNIIINMPGENSDAIRQVGKPAQLRFRKVIKQTDAVGVSDSSPTPSAGASGSASGSATPGATTTAPPTSAPATSAPATPSGSAAPSGTATPRNIQEEQRKIQEKLGPAALAAAQSIQDPSAALADSNLLKQLEPFGKLTPAEVALLPPQLQYNVPTVSCDLLNRRPAGSIDVIDQQVVACNAGKTTKYTMDTAKVVGTDVASARQARDPQRGWTVNIDFTGDGATKWSSLTREAFNNEGGGCEESATAPRDSASGGGGANVCLVAVVLDNEVVSAPAVQAVQTSDSQIYGQFNRESATLLANQIKYGALPITFEPGDVTSISATLGADYLRAGLLAAGIGMLLVIVYAFFYYRLLGSVIFLSLVLSAALTYGMLVLLGRSIGVTLTLAGIAGFIVSLGVAADSFVIYFERLKDEIREGRTPRSAIPRAWIRARRTILTANGVTVLAAVTLWLLGVGQVRGFAFALGLATILDLIIVFLFRHPIMTLLARTPAFLSPRVSGLGRVLHHASQDAPPSRPARTKEA